MPAVTGGVSHVRLDGLTAPNPLAKALIAKRDATMSVVNRYSNTHGAVEGLYNPGTRSIYATSLDPMTLRHEGHHAVTNMVQNGLNPSGARLSNRVAGWLGSRQSNTAQMLGGHLDEIFARVNQHGGGLRGSLKGYRDAARYAMSPGNYASDFQAYGGNGLARRLVMYGPGTAVRGGLLYGAGRGGYGIGREQGDRLFPADQPGLLVPGRSINPTPRDNRVSNQ